MVLRKQNEIDKFIEFIDREWSLSVNEETVLESILNLFLAGKNTEIKKVEHLLNDETEELLKLLNDREVIEYATEEFDLIRNKTYDLEEALDDLNFKWIDKVDIDDMIDYIECKGFEIVETEDNLDIVTQSDLEEMTDLFLNLSPQKRSIIINNLK